METVRSGTDHLVTRSLKGPVFGAYRLQPTLLPSMGARVGGLGVEPHNLLRFGFATAVSTKAT
jgi:hypothetical protein